MNLYILLLIGGNNASIHGPYHSIEERDEASMALVADCEILPNGCYSHNIIPLNLVGDEADKVALRIGDMHADLELA